VKALVWTTTPWTLPSNVALAVNPDVDYMVVEFGGERYLLARQDWLRCLVHDAEHVKVLHSFKGSDLSGIRYDRLYDFADVTPDELKRGCGLSPQTLSPRRTELASST